MNKQEKYKSTLIVDIPFEDLLELRVWNVKHTQQGTIVKLNYAPIDDRDPSYDIQWDNGNYTKGSFWMSNQPNLEVV